MTKHFCFCVLICFTAINAQAQFRKVLHQTFEVDSLQEIHLELNGDVATETWPGNLLMTETVVEIERGARSIFDYFLEGGRYDIVGVHSDSLVVENLADLPAGTHHLTFAYKDSSRLPITLRREVDNKVYEQKVIEKTAVKIYLPDSFEPQNQAATVWRRKPELETALESTDPQGNK